MLIQQVANDLLKASKMNQQADDIENILSKEHADLSAAVTLFAPGSILDASREDVSCVRYVLFCCCALCTFCLFSVSLL